MADNASLTQIHPLLLSCTFCQSLTTPYSKQNASAAITPTIIMMTVTEKISRRSAT